MAADAMAADAMAARRLPPELMCEILRRCNHKTSVAVLDAYEDLWGLALYASVPEDWPEISWAAGRAGRLDVLVEMKERGHTRFAGAGRTAAREGHLDVLEFVRESMGWWSPEILQAAAGRGRLETAKWLRARGCPWGVGAFAAASAGGHLEVMEWLEAGGCPWDAFAVSGAAAAAEWEAVAWLRARGCPWDRRASIAAASRGDAAGLRWLWAAGAPMDFATWLAAARQGSLESLQTLEELFQVFGPAGEGPAEGSGWFFGDGGYAQGADVLAAATRGHLAVVQWLLRPGPVRRTPRRVVQLMRAAKPGHLAVLEWGLDLHAELAVPEVHQRALQKAALDAACNGEWGVYEAVLGRGALPRQRHARLAAFQGDYERADSISAAAGRSPCRRGPPKKKAGAGSCPVRRALWSRAPGARRAFREAVETAGVSVDHVCQLMVRPWAREADLWWAIGRLDRPLGESRRSYDIILAALLGEWGVETMDRLLDAGAKITDFAVGRALSYGTLELLDYFLARGWNSPIRLRPVAGGQDAGRTIRWLEEREAERCPDTGRPAHPRGLFLELGVAAKESERLQRLGHGPLPWLQSRGRAAVTAAAAAGNTGALAWLRDVLCLDWALPDWGARATRVAVERGRLRVLNWLVAEGLFDPAAAGLDPSGDAGPVDFAVVGWLTDHGHPPPAADTAQYRARAGPSA